MELMQPRNADSLDTLEMIIELEDEYGAEAVRWAAFFLEAREIAAGSRPPAGGGDPMWDRDLDG
jgi:hypothetical protein